MRSFRDQDEYTMVIDNLNRTAVTWNSEIPFIQKLCILLLRHSNEGNSQTQQLKFFN